MKPAPCLVSLSLLTACALCAAAANQVLLEAENFGDCGGWVVDQQFMDQMGSPYLLAHGLGEPVRDARTVAKFPSAGLYRVWVRTRNWVAPWNPSEAPGRFQLLVDGKPLAVTFGTEGAQWHWQDGGMVSVGLKATLALHDLTGFEGRCDAVFFSKELSFQPPSEPHALAAFRRRLLGFPAQPENAGQFDLVVVGGGIAGACAAVSAARLGLTVALVQDRPVLGGNGSSEVRVWPEGRIHQPPYPRVGDVVAELIPEKTPRSGNAKPEAIYGDARKLAVARAQRGLTLFLDEHVNAVECRGVGVSPHFSRGNGGEVAAKDAGLTSRPPRLEHHQEVIITAVIAQNIRTGRRIRLGGRWFADCTGDGDAGFLAGADYRMTGREHMGASDLWRIVSTGAPEPFPKCLCQDTNAIDTALAGGSQPEPFPRCPWAVDFRHKGFPGRPGQGVASMKPSAALGAWFWESGFDRNPITDVEWMRDLNLRAMYGAWDYLKNVEHLYPNYKLTWAAYIAGKRESRRLMGDVVLRTGDLRTNRVFADGCFPCTWGIDLHTANPAYAKGNRGSEFIAQYTHGGKYAYAGPYWAPYRCLYSRNIGNLFMAGRDISVTHRALGAVRVMRTCGMMGEVVGMAGSICKEHNCEPRAVYEQYLAELKALLWRGVPRRSEWE
jgi:FAD dependent oxidoreductase